MSRTPGDWEFDACNEEIGSREPLEPPYYTALKNEDGVTVMKSGQCQAEGWICIDNPDDAKLIANAGRMADWLVRLLPAVDIEDAGSESGSWQSNSRGGLVCDLVLFLKELGLELPEEYRR